MTFLLRILASLTATNSVMSLTVTHNDIYDLSWLDELTLDFEMAPSLPSPFIEYESPEDDQNSERDDFEETQNTVKFHNQGVELHKYEHESKPLDSRDKAVYY